MGHLGLYADLWELLLKHCSLWKAENAHTKKAVEEQSLKTSCSLKNLNLLPLPQSEFQASAGSKDQIASLLLLLNVQWRENKWLIHLLLYIYMFYLVNVSEIANYKLQFK